MKISYSWLKEYLSRLPKPEKLADLLTMHSFEVAEIKKSANDFIFDIDILPNRAHDCLSHLGVAKECAAITNLKFKIPSLAKATEDKRKTSDFIKVEVQDKDGCPRYTARVISDIKISSSPKWLREKLENLGQKSINNIVDAANYVMLETGQPLHAFDFEKISGGKIIVRRAKKGEKITTLDNEDYKLDADVLVIADAKGPLALAGIKGGKRAEIDKNTKTIVLESANFNPSLIRNISRKTGLKTEASMRFEYELDPNLTEEAINRVAQIIKEIGNGKIAKGMIDVYSEKVFPAKINLNLKKVANVIGKEIPKQKIIGILKLLGFEVGNSLRVTVPTIRRDIKIQEDLIEEIVRLIGYDQIKSILPMGLVGISRTDGVLTITNKVKTIFEGLGFTEVNNFSFVGEDDLSKTKVSKDGYIELENPLSDDLKYLRKDLLINILKNIKENYKQIFGNDNAIKIFELGKVYCKEDNKTKEEKMLSGAIVRQTEKIKGESFYELKGVIDAILTKLGISDYWYDDFQATSDWTDQIFWSKTGTAEIKIGNEEIGFLGEINSDILNAFNIKRKVVMFNLNFEKLLKLVSEELIYRSPSPYPAAIRDLAVLVNKSDRVGDVMKIIEDTGGELVQDVDLFDMYEGEEIPDNKKNLAFHIIYQSYEKTLKDEEIDKIQRKIIKELEKNNWQVRR